MRMLPKTATVLIVKRGRRVVKTMQTTSMSTY
jgi:hypothetical protein